MKTLTSLTWPDLRLQNLLKISLGCLLSLSASLPLQAAEAESSVLAARDDIFAELKRDYRIEIVYQNLTQTFHPGWLQPPINVKVEALKPSSLPDVLFALEQALAAYPPAVITHNLRLIGLAEQLSFYNQVYGATYVHYSVLDEQGLPYKSDLFLGTFSNLPDFDLRPSLLNLFHHEFSSVLFKNYAFPEKAWLAVNPPDFAYGQGGLQALKQGDNPHTTSEVQYQAGILTRYSMASLEEDINIFSGMAFSEPKKLLSLCQKYPRLSSKLKLWIEFYLSIDADFGKTQLFRDYAAAGYGPIRVKEYYPFTPAPQVI